MITDFGEDIKREKAHLHNPYLRQVTYNKFGSNIKRFKIIDLGECNLPNADKVISFYSRNNPINFFIECKTCEKGIRTGNIALELISSICGSPLDNLPLYKMIRITDPYHAEILKVIRDVKDNNIEGNLGLGLTSSECLSERLYLSYAMVGENGKVAKYLFMHAKGVAEYVASLYEHRPFFMTETEDPVSHRRWKTVGSLIRHLDIWNEEFVRYKVTNVEETKY